MSKMENTPIVFKVNDEEVRLTGTMVKNFLVRGNGAVSDQETMMFINLCKYQKLNPFLNEAYLVKFGSQPAQIIVSKEAFMKRAEKHPAYQGFEAGIIVERDNELVNIEGAVKLTNDKLIGGWAKIFRSDREQPVSVRISLDEFGKGQATWKQMPLNMIRKSAIVNAQREAFPDELGAMYTEEDKGIDEPDEAARKEINEKANQEIIDFEDEPKETPEKEKDEIIDPEPEPKEDPEQPEKKNIIDDEPAF